MHPYEESRESRATWCLAVGGREFSLYLMDGTNVRLVDEKAYRATRPKAEFTSELRAFVGNPEAARQIWGERQEFSVSFAIDEHLVKKWLAAGAILVAGNDITPAMEAEIDALFMPYFWRDVNPHLTDPVPR